MRNHRINDLNHRRSKNPVVKVLGLIIGLLMFAAAVFVGSIMLAALLGFLLIVGLIIYARFWWLTRKIRSARRNHKESYVDAEYRVIETKKIDED